MEKKPRGGPFAQPVPSGVIFPTETLGIAVRRPGLVPSLAPQGNCQHQSRRKHPCPAPPLIPVSLIFSSWRQRAGGWETVEASAHLLSFPPCSG